MLCHILTPGSKQPLCEYEMTPGDSDGKWEYAKCLGSTPGYLEGNVLGRGGDRYANRQRGWCCLMLPVFNTKCTWTATNMWISIKLILTYVSEKSYSMMWRKHIELFKNTHTHTHKYFWIINIHHKIFEQGRKVPI